MESHARDAAPVEVPALIARGARWVDPVLKARVLYGNRTRDNQLRHAVFRGLREPEFSQSRNAAPAKRYITDAHLASIWVTNPERRMFSKTGPTKLDLAVYYAKVGDAMLPHILSRPVSLVRCPSGKIEDCFFQRHAFAGMPAEVTTFVSKREKDEEERNYLVIVDAAGFLALAQFGVIEFHPWGCRVDKPERPDRMFFDLDPGEGVEWRDVKAAAKAMREELSRAGVDELRQDLRQEGHPRRRADEAARIRGRSCTRSAARSRPRSQSDTPEPSSRRWRNPTVSAGFSSIFTAMPGARRRSAPIRSAPFGACPPRRPSRGRISAQSTRPKI